MADNPYYWDQTNDSKMGKYITKFEFSFLTSVLENMSNDISILVVGCGSGKEVEYIYNNGFHNITGTDPDPDYLSIAKKKIPQLKTKVDIAPDIKFDDNSFDMVVALEMTGYFEDQRKFFSEVSRVLKPGGSFVVQVTNKVSVKAVFYRIYDRMTKSKKVPFAYKYSYFETRSMLELENLKIKKALGFNWNILYRASNSWLVNVCANIEKLGLIKLPKLSPWVMIEAIKEK